MPIKATCPTCTKSYMLADTQAGKRVRCKHCADTFEVPSAAAADPPILEPIDAPPADDVYTIAPSDAPPVKARSAPPPLRPRPGAPRRQPPRPDSGFRAPQTPSSPLVPFILLGGVALAFVLLLSGIFAMSGSSPKDKDGPRAQNDDGPRDGRPRDIQPRDDRPRDDVQPRDNGPRDLQPRDNQPRDNQPRDKDRPRDNPQPVEDFSAEAKNLDEALTFLKHPNALRRRMGALWFLRANVDENRRAEVARALEPLVKDPDGTAADNASGALIRWATREQVPTLITIMQKGDHRNGEAMTALATLKDPRALPPLMARFKMPGQSPFVTNALRTWGPDAEKEVVKLLHDPDPGMRGNVNYLLGEYKTKEEAMLTQTITDLGSANAETKRSAVAWLMSRPKVTEEKRADVAKALNPVLVNADALNIGTALSAVEKWWTKDSVPALVQLLSDPKIAIHRRTIINLLGKTKDERAAKPLADLLEKGVGLELFAAKGALKELGAAAEPAVKAKLTSTNVQARQEACNLLGDIGTRDSLGDLKRLSTADPNFLVKNAAAGAVRKIEAREKK